MKTIRRSTSAKLGAIGVLLLLIIAVIGPALAGDPLLQDLPQKHEGPSRDHWLGTDHLGRDILSRILCGARISLSLSCAAVALALAVGLPLGLASGYFGGAVDQVLMRAMDVLLALPTYVLAIFMMAILGPAPVNIAIAVGVSSLPAIARTVRASTMSLVDTEMIEAARSVGVPWWRIMFKHILPNIMSPIYVLASFRLGTAILTESALSFLGLGLSPPIPAWGVMIQDGLRFLRANASLSALPGAAIMFTVLSFNLLGDGLRDALDVRLRGA